MRKKIFSRKVVAMLAAVALLFSAFPLHALADGVYGEAQVTIIGAAAVPAPEVTVDGDDLDFGDEPDTDGIWRTDYNSRQYSTTTFAAADPSLTWSLEDADDWIDPALAEDRYGLTFNAATRVLSNDGQGEWGMGYTGFVIRIAYGGDTIAEILLHVTGPSIVVDSVDVTPPTADVDAGDNQQFNAAVTGTFGTGTFERPLEDDEVDLVWSMRDNAGAVAAPTGVTLSQTGLLTAAANAPSNPGFRVRASAYPLFFSLTDPLEDDPLDPITTLYITERPVEADGNQARWSIYILGTATGEFSFDGEDPYLSTLWIYDEHVDGWEFNIALHEGDGMDRTPELDVRANLWGDGTVPPTYSGIHDITIMRGGMVMEVGEEYFEGNYYPVLERVGGVTATVRIVMDW